MVRRVSQSGISIVLIRRRHETLLTFVIAGTFIDLGLQNVVPVTSHFPGSFEHDVLLVPPVGSVRDRAGSDVYPLQLGRGVVYGGVKEGVAVVDWFPGFIHVFDFWFWEHVVSKLGRF